MPNPAQPNQELSEEIKDQLRSFDVVGLAKREAIVDKLLESVARGEDITPILNVILQAGIVQNFTLFRKIALAAEKSALRQINATD